MRKRAEAKKTDENVPDDEVEILEDMEGEENEDFDGENKDEISGTEEKTEEAGEEVKWS